MKLTGSLFIFLLTGPVFGQSTQSLPTNSRLSVSTLEIIARLDSMLRLNPELEFREIGEASDKSKKFVLYSKLEKTATQQELLSLINNNKHLAAIRGYAYMAYAFRCDSIKKKELSLNYSFTVNTLNGCIGHDLTFSDFKKYCRVRSAYDPNPRKPIRDFEEKRVIKEENGIREEHGQNRRK